MSADDFIVGITSIVAAVANPSTVGISSIAVAAAELDRQRPVHVGGS